MPPSSTSSSSSAFPFWGVALRKLEALKYEKQLA